MKFDNLTPDRIAVSIKTLDTITAKYLLRPASITRTINGYVDALADFEGEAENWFRLTPDKISGKTMHLGIPAKTMLWQMVAISRSILYAKTKGVQVVVTRVAP